MLQLDFDKIDREKGMSRGGFRRGRVRGSPQEIIEWNMQQIVRLGHYETAYLFTEDGLPLAEVKAEDSVGKDFLVETSVFLQGVRKTAERLGSISALNEVVLEGRNRRRIVFRFVEAFGQSAVLAIVIPPRKTFRRLTNRLVTLIKKTTAD